MNLATMVQSGKPQTDGRYVVFVQCDVAAAKAWVEPLIMAWSGERWHTTYIANRRILGWIGPLPVLKVDDLALPVFDL